MPWSCERRNSKHEVQPVWLTRLASLTEEMVLKFALCMLWQLSKCIRVWLVSLVLLTVCRFYLVRRCDRAMLTVSILQPPIVRNITLFYL